MLSHIGFSQETGKVKYGLFGGINVSKLTASASGQGTSSSDSKVGPNFGVLAEIPVGGDFAIQPEVSYSNMGWKENETDIDENTTVDNARYNMNYLSIPVLVKYKITNTLRNGNGLAVFLGPQYGYLLSANLKGSNTNGSADIKKAFKSSDFSAVAGVEYFLPQGIGLSLRYQFGIMNVFGKEANDLLNADAGSNVSVRNNALTLTVGYRF